MVRVGQKPERSVCRRTKRSVSVVARVSSHSRLLRIHSLFVIPDPSPCSFFLTPPPPTHLLFHSLYRTLRERAAVSRHRGIVDAAPPRPSSSPLFPLFSFPSRFLFALLSINSSLPPLLAFFLAMCRGDGARWLSTYVPRFLYFFPFLLVGESRSR